MARLGEVDTPARLMWNPLQIPAAYLPWLAWALSVDDWDPDWDEETKREVIAGSVEVHRVKGTRRSVEMALQSTGYPNAVIVEDRDLPRYGTGWRYGADWKYGPETPHWADYWVDILAPISRTQAEVIALRLARVAPARCRLRAVRLAGVFFEFGDGAWVYGNNAAYGGIYQVGG